MNYKKIYLYILIIISVISCQEKQEKPKVEKSKKPNILFLFADDQTYSSIHALGNKEVKTPNIDKLVRQGTSFTHTYNMGGWDGAICAASRAMIISGRSIWDVNKFRKQYWKKGDSLQRTWPAIMKKNGYDTYMTGKWHVDFAPKKAFKEAEHVRPGMPKDAWNQGEMSKLFKGLKADKVGYDQSIYPIGYARPKNKMDTTWSPSDPKFGGFYEGGKHWTKVLEEDALSFLDKAKTSPNPFFMYLAFNAPHDPRQAPKKYQDMYNLDSISLPKSFLPENPYKAEMDADYNLRDEALAPYPRTPYAIKVHTKEYYASITYLDEQVGLILDKLEAIGATDNTYIIFTADHGLAIGRHGLIGKQNMYDHSIRVPLILKGPNIPKNKIRNQDVYLQDVMPTSMDFAGFDAPKYVFFKSFKSIIQDEQSKTNYPAIYGTYKEDAQKMIRKDGFKLIYYPRSKRSLLFDMNEDPEELLDLSYLPEYADKKKQLFDSLKLLMKKMHDPLEL